MLRRKLDKKGQVMDQFGALAIGVVTVAIVLTVAFLIMAQAKTQANTITNNGVTDGNATINATNTLINATASIPGWIPIIIITAIGAVLIGMVMMFRRAGG